MFKKTYLVQLCVVVEHTKGELLKFKKGKKTS